MAILKNKHLMSLGAHLDELRSRLIKALLGVLAAFVVSLVFGREVIRFLSVPFNKAMPGDEASLVVLSPAGGIMLYMQICLYVALLLSGPWVLYQLWLFVAAGLYKKERRIVTRIIPISAGLFLAGGVFFFFAVSGVLLQSFHAFNAWLGLREMVTLDAYLKLMISMTLVFGLSFQVPLVVWVLVRTGLVPIEKIAHYRRHVILGLFILAAICTSPSPVDQILMAVPMWLLFELGLFMAKPKRRKNQDLSA